MNLNQEIIKPALKLSDFVNEPTYIPGYTFAVRFQGKKGYFTKGNPEISLSDPGEEFKVVIVGYRRFKAENLFGRQNHDWVELYFYSKNAFISSLLLSGYNAVNFDNYLVYSSKYTGIPPNKFITIIKPIQSSVQKENKTFSFWRIEFSKGEDLGEKDLFPVITNIFSKETLNQQKFIEGFNSPTPEEIEDMNI